MGCAIENCSFSLATSEVHFIPVIRGCLEHDPVSHMASGSQQLPILIQVKTRIAPPEDKKCG
jgi:hypothetical protein